MFWFLQRFLLFFADGSQVVEVDWRAAGVNEKDALVFDFFFFHRFQHAVIGFSGVDRVQRDTFCFHDVVDERFDFFIVIGVAAFQVAVNEVDIGFVDTDVCVDGFKVAVDALLDDWRALIVGSYHTDGINQNGFTTKQSPRPEPGFRRTGAAGKKDVIEVHIVGFGLCHDFLIRFMVGFRPQKAMTARGDEECLVALFGKVFLKRLDRDIQIILGGLVDDGVKRCDHLTVEGFGFIRRGEENMTLDVEFLGHVGDDPAMIR